MGITELQRMWLTAHGDRTEDDVINIDGEYFVAMRSKNNYVAVLIPSDIMIKKRFNVIKNILNKTILSYKTGLWRTF